MYIHNFVHMTVVTVSTAVTDRWLVQVQERLPCSETMRRRDTGWRSPTTYPSQNGNTCTSKFMYMRSRAVANCVPLAGM